MFGCRAMALTNNQAILSQFLPFNPKGGSKKIPTDILILHRCSSNYEICLVVELWLRINRQDILGQFMPFHRPGDLKINILKK